MQLTYSGFVSATNSPRWINHLTHDMQCAVPAGSVEAWTSPFRLLVLRYSCRPDRQAIDRRTLRVHGTHRASYLMAGNGYLDGEDRPSPGLLDALDHTDRAIGQIVD